jgi:hypothetical protein
VKGKGLSARYRLLVSLAPGLVAGLVVGFTSRQIPAALLGGWDVAALVFIVCAWRAVWSLGGRTPRSVARVQPPAAASSRIGSGPPDPAPGKTWPPTPPRPPRWTRQSPTCAGGQSGDALRVVRNIGWCEPPPLGSVTWVPLGAFGVPNEGDQGRVAHPVAADRAAMTCVRVQRAIRVQMQTAAPKGCSASDQPRRHVSIGNGDVVDRPQRDLSAVQQLLLTVRLPAPLVDQRDPATGKVPKQPDPLRRHETGPNHTEEAPR